MQETGQPAGRIVKLKDLHDATILVVDDQPANLRLLERLLTRDGYTDVHTRSDSREALAAFQQTAPDIVLLDMQMPHLDGFGVLAQIAPLVASDDYLPVIVITGDPHLETRQRALASGAKDFLTKPFDATEVLLRIRNLLETRRLHLQLRAYNEQLEMRVRERTEELERARHETIERLAIAAEYRDDDTGQHARRVGIICGRLALELGMSREYAELMRRAAPLHDVGKIGIPDAILLKAKPLSAEEFSIIRRHTDIGAGILGGSSSPVLRMAEEIARYHHERWDGNGYLGVKEEDIPLSGRIVAVVDMYDALVSDRPYKRAWAHADAVAEIRRLRGTHLDPAVVDAFLDLYSNSGAFQELLREANA